MGRSLDADFVVGVKLGDYDPETYETINPIPEAVFAQFEVEGSDAWISGELEVEGLKFQKFWTMEQDAAFGVRLDCDIDYVSTFDVVELQKQIDEVMPVVKRVFEQWGVTQEPEVLLVLDYS